MLPGLFSTHFRGRSSQPAAMAAVNSAPSCSMVREGNEGLRPNSFAEGIPDEDAELLQLSRQRAGD